MKCKVCGYEFDPGREYCPMCGSKVPEHVRRKEEEEMSWNTYDFPKAKKLEDIEMHWPSMNPRPEAAVSVMNKDASEGFVRAASPAKAEPEQPKKPEAPMPDPWAQVSREFPRSSYPAPEGTQPAAPQPMPPFPSSPVFPSAPQPAAPAPQSKPQPESVPAPAPAPAPQNAQPAQPQQSAFPQGAWQMPQMQETPSWTPYNVQAPQQTMQMPPIPPTYVPTSFTQAYGAQYSQQQYTQPQTAWTVPPQPAPGSQVFVTQPAQPVYIQPAPVTPVTPPVYAPVYPQYTQPVPPVQPAPAAEPAPQPEPAPAVEPVPQPEPVPEPEPAPAPAEEPKEKVLEEHIVATIGKPAEKAVEKPVEEPAPAPQPEPVPEPGPVPEPASAAPAASEPEPDEDGRYPERFFTFNKKNEEFQKLLDQQLERVHNLHGGDYHDDLTHTFIYKKNTFQPTPAQDFFHNEELSTDLSELEQMIFSGTKDSEGDETLAINRDRIRGAALSAEDLIEPLPVKPGDTTPLSEPAPQEKAEPEAPAEPEIPMTKEELARKEHRDRMAAMAKAREEYFASLRNMTAEMRAVKEKETADFRAKLAEEARVSPDMVTREKAPEKTPEQVEAEKAEEARLAAEREAAERAAAIERAKAEMEAAKEAQQKELEKEQAEAAEADELDEALQQAAETAKEEPETPAEPEETGSDEEEPEEEPERNKTAVFDEILDDVDEENEKREKREHSHWFLKFLLALAIVIAAAEGGTVALRHYAPDSPASIITTSIEQNVIQFVETGIDALKDKFHKEEAQPEPQDEQQESGEEAPAFVLSDIIAECNKNIGTVEENLGIGYDSQRTYDIPGLSSSQLVTDTAEKTKVCKTLIGYNSSWIDFVNGESQDCLNYLKADGVAYRSAVTFDKIGQITEKFLKLEIGEIRKTDDAYFVFAGESIEVTQDETPAQSSGYMVYELVPVGEELKIKDYYNITN